jgi:hypothetical protein
MDKQFLRFTAATFPLIFFTAVQTCYWSEQKIFAQPDDCAAL